VLNSAYFSRNRKLNLTHLIGHILQMVCSRNANGYAITSQNYFSQLEEHLHRELPSASRSSLCEARQKLHWRAFEYLLRQSNLRNEEIPENYKWKGHVVRAGDGSKITLPNSKEILKKFPQRKAAKSPEGTLSHYPFAQLVTACNVMTGQPTAARLYNMYGSEREGLMSMVKEEFRANDICLLDRGLDGMRVWNTFDKNKQFHVTRLREIKGKGASHLKYVHQFLRSNKKEITIKRQSKDPKTGEMMKTQLRLIRGRRLKDGSFLVVGTNLLDKKKYPACEVIELYARRWNIETMYKRVKTLMNLQSFHAKQPNGILQEVFAHLLVLSMTSAIAIQAARVAGLNPKEVSPNLKNATEVMKRNLFFYVTSVHENRKATHYWANKIYQEVLRILCKKQPGRSYPRYSRQPMNMWSYAKASKIALFKQGRRCNENTETKAQYVRDH
jgi:hypothetical protein